MKISELANGLKIKIAGSSDREITDITYDSRKVSANSLFAALRGSRQDGKNFIKDAVAKGAAAVLTDDKTAPDSDAVYLLVDDVPEILGKISSVFYGSPSENMKIFAVTGTNGKTTITYLLEKIFQCAGIKLGVIGTISYRFGTLNIPAPNTTPQSPDLHKLLSEMKKAGADGAAMEVSSHGIVQNRISGCALDAAVFTNLTRDHLDYHKTMDEYKKAKFLLFEKFLAGSPKKQKFSVINTDDPAGKELTKIAPGGIITYGIKSSSEIRATDIEILKNRTKFNVCIGSKKIGLATKLVGRYNIYNILAAVGVAYSQDLPIDRVSEGIGEFETVPGRFETVDAGQPFAVIIDYAHTPDALGNLIQSARTLKHKRVITVFGCGGDRDRSKRPMMGEISGRLSDYTVITSDNPRSEKPERIALDVEVGFRRINCKNYEVAVDRAEAVKRAISVCGPDDILLIAGKGPENYQIVGEEKIPYNDKETVMRILSQEKWKK